MHVRQHRIARQKLREVLYGGIGKWLRVHAGGYHYSNMIQLTGHLIDDDTPAAMHYAKDRDTIIRYLGQSDQTPLRSTIGPLVFFEGEYNRGIDTARVKNFLAAPLARLVSRAHGIDSSWVSQRLLNDRGYYLLFVGRAAFTDPPKDMEMVTLNDYQATMTQVIARMA